ncbi:hypothetical protein [Phyllobacterium sophorae]|uniref:hypothetical protein n=1 Tax=Phyllobacterium sophorae TaxID=1520277 RepID=UPI0011B291CE|nr:hypothetical protein [Phyllobacterium sophorae]
MPKSLPGREDTCEKREKRQAQLNDYLFRKGKRTCRIGHRACLSLSGSRQNTKSFRENSTIEQAFVSVAELFI